MRYATIDEAAHAWVREFSTIPQGMIAKLMETDLCDWTEVTKPTPGDRVYAYNLPEGSKENWGCIKSYDEETELYCIELDDGKLLSADDGDFELDHDGTLPMWGWLWQFKDSADDWWVEEGEGIRCLSECGFRVYQSKEFGYFFGIDGAGYDFYSSHWIPLYHARGLRWADEQYEHEEVS